MKKDTAREPKKPEETCQDVLTEVLRKGAQKMLVTALEAEVELFLKQYTHLRDEEGKRLVVRCGYSPEREIQTGLGPMPVKAPRVTDRRKNKEDKVHFSSTILPPYLRMCRNVSPTSSLASILKMESERKRRPPNLSQNTRFDKNSLCPGSDYFVAGNEVFS